MAQKDEAVSYSELCKMYGISVIYKYVYMLSSMSVFEVQISKNGFFEQLLFSVYFYM